jgi:hypothetical protein
LSVTNNVNPPILTAQQIKEKTKRLWQAYRWTWERYWALGTKQGWRCAICGREAKNAPLNVDHRHPKFTAVRGPKVGWAAWSDIDGTDKVWAATKKEALRLAKELALPLSVRGLLCPGRHRGCNRLLGRVDDPEWLEKARNYLLDPPAKSVL